GKAHYAAEQLTSLDGVRMKFDRPFFKEFSLAVTWEVPSLLQRLLAGGYHGGLALGRWYAHLADCVSVAVTEKRTIDEIDGLVRNWHLEKLMAHSEALLEE